MNFFIQSIKYVALANGFFGSMGFTTAIGMLIGAIIHNGDLKKAAKGVVTTLAYAFMVTLTGFLRVFPNISGGSVFEKSYAGTITPVVVAMFYVCGIGIGVFIVSLVHKKYRNEST